MPEALPSGDPGDAGNPSPHETEGSPAASEGVAGDGRTGATGDGRIGATGDGRIGATGDAGDARSGDAATIRLDQYLKLTGHVRSGGEAKHRIQSGDVKVNGATENHRSRKLRRGDKVEMDGNTVEAEW
jgi:ribosome-associated protein